MNNKKVRPSHSRVFKPDNLTAPRDFRLPQFISSISSLAVNKNKFHSAAHTLGDKTANSSRPLILEIGAGKGKHACEYAAAHPDHDVIAVERTAEKFKAFFKRLTCQPQSNLEAVHADAIPYCVYALPPQSVDKVFILYPNPEPKNPNQQWLNMPFFEFLLSRVKSQGKLILATNIESYVMNAQSQATDTWHLSAHLSQVPGDSERTHFEIKYLQRGEICWELTLCKPVDYQTRFDTWCSKVLQSEYIQ